MIMCKNLRDRQKQAVKYTTNPRHFAQRWICFLVIISDEKRFIFTIFFKMIFKNTCSKLDSFALCGITTNFCVSRKHIYKYWGLCIRSVNYILLRPKKCYSEYNGILYVIFDLRIVWLQLYNNKYKISVWLLNFNKS